MIPAGLDRVWHVNMQPFNTGWRRRRRSVCDALGFLLVLAFAAVIAFGVTRATGTALGWLIHLGQHWTEVPR